MNRPVIKKDYEEVVDKSPRNPSAPPEGVEPPTS